MCTIKVDVIDKDISLKRFLNLCLQMKRSIVAFVVTLALGLLSMGALGMAIGFGLL